MAVLASQAGVTYDSARGRRDGWRSVLDVWRSRELVMVLARRDVVRRYKRSVLGVWWTLLTPLVTGAVMWVVFSSLFKTPGGRAPYVIYLFSGIVLVTLFQQAVMAAAVAVAESAPLMASVRVPGAVFPLAAVMSALTAFAAAFVVLLVLLVVTGSSVSAALPACIVPVLATAAMAAGIGMLIGVIAARFYDVLDIARLGLSLLTYATPIFYPLSIIPSAARPIIEANPLYQSVTVFRACIYGSSASSVAWAATALAGVVLLVVGAWTLHRRMPDVLVRL